MHVERVVEAVSQVVDWEVLASVRPCRQLILLIVEVHGNRRPVDVLWAPAEGHVWLERVVAPNRRQFHRWHLAQDLPPQIRFAILLLLLLFRTLVRRGGAAIFDLGLTQHHALAPR